MNFMPYQFQEGAITLPDTWQDQSMNVFVLPGDTGINLVINRAPVPHGMTDDEYYQEVFHQFRHNLKNYHEISSDMVQLDEKPAHLLEYQWKSPEGMMYQCTLLQIRHNLLLTFTYTAQSPFSKKQREALLDIVYSFKATKQGG
ncbi:hypothetical protein SAMN05660772_02780 [Pasteurella testudinis DSM 23072]|uniref:DUF1795 domain-containing protein n=1 Tax=Pasteurella testudinis DSM 23072 TaxID=1122938 RepID=A0A1W1V3W3_9PAST|nr:DUF1795 domain-containing protein [Pasteurella testudinis]SMB87953.1 hypothetical protein SAMN05660772_02780 [Pasteurella testudinis DSM 23072]SUB52176.1 Uncharacterized conserved protein [Pasteurella testudinis]